MDNFWSLLHPLIIICGVFLVLLLIIYALVCWAVAYFHKYYEDDIRAFHTRLRSIDVALGIMKDELAVIEHTNEAAKTQVAHLEGRITDIIATNKMQKRDD